MSLRTVLLAGLAAAAVVIAFLLPPISQDPAYHHFADSRTILGVPNFWNVASNMAFLLVALWGATALKVRGAFLEAWERSVYSVLLIGLGLVAFGSGYYHSHPSDSTLFWDRLPMAMVFMALLSITLGERVDAKAGRMLFVPLAALGVCSLIDWRVTGDLRAYGLVQFYPMLALPMMLVLFPARYTRADGIWAMIALYALAKILEFADGRIWSVAAPLSGHPWKHFLGAAAMLCYVQAVRHRRPVMPGEATAYSSRVMRFERGA